MTAWLSLNIVIFAAVMLFGWWGSSARAEGGHIANLAFLGGLGCWMLWVLVGSGALLMMQFKI